MGQGSIFFHSISKNLQTSLKRRQTALSAKNMGGAGGMTGPLRYRYAKVAYAELYWHCPKTPKKDELVVGSKNSASYKKSLPNTTGGEISLYSAVTNGDDSYFPPAQLESVSITNEGRVGSLQKASGVIKCYTLAQLGKLEKQILFPGADIKIEYGWTGGLGLASCDKDTFIGIMSNFGWSVNADLSINVSFESVGKGFAVNSVTSTGLNPDNKDFAEDEQKNKIFADTFPSKIKADLKDLKDKLTKPGFYTSKKGGYSMVYGVQKFKYDPSTDVPEKTEGGKATEAKPPDEQIVTYVKLSDILNYFNVIVIDKTRAGGGDGLRQIRFSANYGIDKEGKNGEQEKAGAKTSSEDVYFPVSISMYDPELVSSDPGSILFNDCACYMKEVADSGSPESGFLKIEDGPGLYEYARFKRTDNQPTDSCVNDGGVNIGEILIGTTFLLDVLQNLSVNAKDPIQKSVQALGNELFKKISEVSGGLYQFSWTEVTVPIGEGTTNWICVTDSNFTVCDPPIWTFHVDKPGKSLVTDFSISSKIPSGQQTALYVGGRSTGATDGNFTSAAKVTNQSKTESCQTKQDVADAQAAAASVATGDTGPSLNEAREAMGKNGCTETTRISLNGALKKYLAEKKKAVADGGSDRYTFMRRDLYPLDCSISIDGIAGFRFGDAVMITYVPSRYKGTLCFIVTKSSHEISGNKWKTTLSLQARTLNTKGPTYLNGW